MKQRETLSVRLKPEVYAALCEVAERNHRSMSGQVAYFVEHGLQVESGEIITHDTTEGYAWEPHLAGQRGR